MDLWNGRESNHWDDAVRENIIADLKRKNAHDDQISIYYL